MRISSLMLCSFFLMVNLLIASPGNGQSTQKKINIDFKNTSMRTVLEEIKKKADVEIMCEMTQPFLNDRVNISMKNSTVTEVLDSLLKSKNINWEIRDNIIFIGDATSIASPAEHLSTPLLSPSLTPPPITVRGRIVNENGEPVIASVIIKGTTRGTTSDANGEFELSGINSDATLIISATNIEKASINVNNQKDLSITVKNTSASLNEVVINKGYYSETKRLSTGNVSKVDGKDIEKQPVSNPLLALQGRVTGVQITQQTGVPGGGVTLQIRGKNSLRDDGNLPLYVVDGVPFSGTLPSGNLGAFILGAGNPLNYINPKDIERIEILKDADATAIYGSRGANGVVLITTKKVINGKANFSVNYNMGLGKVASKIDLLNTVQYIEMREEAFKNAGAEPGPQDYDVNGTWERERYTDWQDVMIGGTAKIMNAGVSLSGGNENVKYLLGGLYYRETTVFPGDFSDQKISTHFNIDHVSTNKKFKSNFSGSFLVDNNKIGAYDMTSDALELSPNAPEAYTPDGFINWENQTFDNPFALLAKKFNSRVSNLIGNLSIGYELFKGLEIRSSMGYTQLQLNEIRTEPSTSFNPAFGPATGKSGFGSNQVRTWNLEPQINFHRKIGPGNLSAILGISFQQTQTTGEVLEGSGYSSDILLSNIKDAPSISVVSSINSLYKYNAGFGRINYEIDGKYVINLTGRRDGSSRFGPGKQFANFGAIGAAWIFSEENFIQQYLPVISFGKIRASYGSSGNDQIEDYKFYDLWNTARFTYNQILGFTPNNLFNDNYHWETNQKLEFSIDLGFWKNRILLGTSYYRNRSGNQLVGLNLPTITGFPTITANFPAEVQNTGLEAELRTVNISKVNLKWTTGVNITIPRNKLVAYPGIENSAFKYRYAVGESLDIQNKYAFSGVDPQTGIYLFEDINNNGFADWPADLQRRKKVAQQFYGGLINNINFKNWQFDVIFQYVKQTGVNYKGLYQSAPGYMSNQPTYVMSRWRKPGDNTDIQQFTTGYSDAYLAYFNSISYGDNTISDASFIRLKNINISYNLPLSSTNRSLSTGVKIFIQCQNLFTITSYKGIDPESQSFNLPPLRMITAGFQITF